MSGWEVVIGIEIHVQLRTRHKLFCADRVAFGVPPNTNVCPVCLGLPGALPAANADAVRLAVRTGLVLGCTVHEHSVWARKNYFYPDLPKGYQITQFEAPLATGGRVDFEGGNGETSVRIRRIHMEEDAGKLLHDRVPGATAVDLNRAGTPLVEIVTEPDLRSAGDVRAFLGVLKQILEYADVSDCNMEEGSLRADANVSLRRPGSVELGTKTEIKNVNSFSGIEKALNLEVRRQSAVLDAGGTIDQQTLLWDDHRGEVRPMRSKEESHDYRYFPDPDLPPLVLSEAEIEAVRSDLPRSPRQRRDHLESTLGLSAYDADVLTQSRALADYFDRVTEAAPDVTAKTVANWVMGPVRALMNERKEDLSAFAVAAPTLASVLTLVAEGTISDGAGKKVLTVLAEEGGEAGVVVDRLGLAQVRDEAQIESWVDQVISEHPEEAERVRGGEERLVGFLVGKVMRASQGAADPKRVNALLRGRLAR